MAGVEWRVSRVRAVLLLALSVLLLAALAVNLRTLDPSVDLPPPPDSQSPGEAAVEGYGNPLRIIYGISVVSVGAIVVGAILLVRRQGGNLWSLFTKWELLAFAVVATFILVLFLFWGNVETGLAQLLNPDETGGEEPTAGGTGGGGGGPGEFLLVGSRSATALIIVLTIATAYFLFFSLAYVPRLYRSLGQRRSEATRDRQELARAMRIASEDLEAGGDFREAVLRCYKAMLLLFESRGMVPHPAQTAREFEAAALSLIGLSRDGIDGLTSLFEEARYSEHPIGAGQRDSAIASLGAVRAELEGIP